MKPETISHPAIREIAIEQIPQNVLEKVSLEYLLAFRLLPIEWLDGKLKLAVTRPYPFYPIDNLALALNASVEIFLMEEKRIEQTLRRLMESRLKSTQGVLRDLRLDLGPESRELREDLIRDPSEAPIVRMVNSILLEAVQKKATDIHFHPQSSGLSVLYRNDGLLHEMHQISQGMQEGVIARLKVMAKLDVTQKRLPQDGRISLKSADREVEVRVSAVPTLQGERLVLRLLDRENLLLKARDLGMKEKDYQSLRVLMDRPTGMILVTGPTGSGKTTTLYSFISEMDLEKRNVMTIEDPVEYKIEGITQMPVKPTLGLTFAQGLRAILRQDPDVILVGEIRDQETAQIAIRSALTGHLVLSTLHTTDAPGAITRLMDIGMEPYLISSALMAVISQRLVRKICGSCHGSGCDQCFLTGFKGRTGVFEYLPLDDDFREKISEQQDVTSLRREMKRKGICSLEEEAREKVLQGVTTEKEILRVMGV
ncbi:MAG: type II/IV secretion system protein [Chlamydiae bacterium]|nr:type II/IV secretion system protein [Chlamydiota bacterium]MBI3266730.1 type II/IV secretion system protein [Chlamydiota bacterium]